MSAASRAKSAKARATIFLRYLATVQDLNRRSFFDCLEMGDGEEVVREVRRRAKSNPETAALLRRRSYGFWLEPGYIKDAPGVPQ